MNIMNKEEVKAKLRKAESDLRSANVILEMHEQGVQEIKEDIAKLQAIINKPDRWQDSLVQPDKEQYFYLMNNAHNGLVVGLNSEGVRKPEHAFRTGEQAELIKEKVLLMQEMYAFTHVRNEGWMPDWEERRQEKYGILLDSYKVQVEYFSKLNQLVFGIAVKNREIAEEMLEIFGERIEKFYNKMY